MDTKSNVSNEEKLTLENKALEERNKYLEVEIGLLKKGESARIGSKLNKFQAINEYPQETDTSLNYATYWKYHVLGSISG